VKTLGTIVMAEKTPSQNAFSRELRHPFRYTQLKARMTTWVMVGMVNGKIPKATTRRRRLTITRYTKHASYQLDRGNFVGGCKPLLDAAIGMALIVDDKEQWLDDIYIQRVSKDERTEILVEEFEEDVGAKPEPGRMGHADTSAVLRSRATDR